MNVTCAVIVHEGRILCAQRSAVMRHPLLWEFPGGKQEEGESLEACLVREIKEELNLIIRIERALPAVQHDYGNGLVITLYPFICSLLEGELVCKEHQAIAWLLPDELRTIDWVAADVDIVMGLGTAL